MSNLSNLLDHCRHKLWMYVSLEDVEISKAKEERVKKMVKENREIEGDISTLKMVADYTARLHCPHKDLDEINRQVSLFKSHILIFVIFILSSSKSDKITVVDHYHMLNS